MQVTRWLALAGMPEEVVALARKYLMELSESASSEQPQRQANLFPPARPSAAELALEALTRINPDNLSPREALDVLYELKQLSRDDN